MRVPDFIMTQTCTIKPYLGHTPTGRSFGTSYEATCRFEPFNQKILDREGKEFISKGKLFLLPDEENFALRLDSQVTVDGEPYTIIQKINHRGFVTSHVECVVV